MKKKILCLVLACVTLFGVLIIPAAYAEDDEMQVKRLESELKEIKNRQATARNKLTQLKNAQSNENAILAAQTSEINLIKENIETTESLLEIYTNQISAKEAEIDSLEGKLDKAIEIFKKRLVYYHENNTNPDDMWMSVIFESESFLDLLQRVEVSKELMEYDKNLVESIKDNLAEQKRQKEEIQLASDTYTENFNRLREQESELAEKINQSQATVDEFQSIINQHQAELDEETAAAAAAEKELKRLMEEMKKRNTPSYNYSASGFIWPLPKSYIISSWWGYRKDPFTGRQAYHNGLDIATSGTSPEIYAIAGGEVITAGGNPYTGYGYYVIIDHGGGFQSLYGHMNKWPSVSKGDMVKQGQVIGYVGTTGRSTGKHLHFTIYKDGKDVNPLNYVNQP